MLWPRNTINEPVLQCFQGSESLYTAEVLENPENEELNNL